MSSVPRLYILYCGICLTTEELHGKPQSGYPKGARLICAERDSFSRFGQRERWPRLAYWPLPPLAFASGDAFNHQLLKLQLGRQIARAGRPQPGQEGTGVIPGLEGGLFLYKFLLDILLCRWIFGVVGRHGLPKDSRLLGT